MQKWKLLSKKDASPHAWFPIEMRTYQLPDGRIIDDFSVTTLADVGMVIAKTIDGKIILVKQFKPGVNDLMIQFPAGRTEPYHEDMQTTAAQELEEETGIKVNKDSLRFVTKLNFFSTKASEVVFLYYAENCEFNSQQHLDQNEEIEVLEVSPAELNAMIDHGEIWCGQTIAMWEMLKKKYPQAAS